MQASVRSCLALLPPSCQADSRPPTPHAHPLPSQPPARARFAGLPQLLSGFEVVNTITPLLSGFLVPKVGGWFDITPWG